MRCWKPEDIFWVNCARCGTEIEFWKDEVVRVCPACRTQLRNPRIDCSCTQWCKHVSECLPGMIPLQPSQ